MVPAVIAGLAVTALGASAALGCGCFSPPVPAPLSEEAFAVNQQSEQIIFEVDPLEDRITAHVLIQFSGSPEQFAWLVPVPSVPDLALSPAGIFGLLERFHGPGVSNTTVDLCPRSLYRCAYHGVCGDEENSEDAGGNGGDDANNGTNNATNNGGVRPGGVEVIRRETIGAYDTVIFSAEEATGAVDWLRSEGFIVNETMGPYMQPYFDAGMVFVASKLVPGAGVDAIKPLRMTYQGHQPMIPLRLTAVAAEPHLTVTTWIYGVASFAPKDHPTVAIDAGRLSTVGGRSNYPMVLARAIDDAGGDAFVAEYSGLPGTAARLDPSGCCEGGDDLCGVANDGLCQCPVADFDQADCAAEEDLVESVHLLDDLAARHPWLTRLTTRVSPEEMSFDPVFELRHIPAMISRFDSSTASLDNCRDDVTDGAALERAEAIMGCSTVYCGRGECVATRTGAGCACEEGFVARRFVDLDGAASVTCVPVLGTVDLGAGGLSLPDACGGVICGGEGSRCVDVGGFPSCVCPAGQGATLRGDPLALSCDRIAFRTNTPGAENFSVGLEAVPVCVPRPPDCGPTGWLVESSATLPRSAVICADSLPPDAALIPPEYSCVDEGAGDAGDVGRPDTDDTDDAGGPGPSGPEDAASGGRPPLRVGGGAGSGSCSAGVRHGATPAAGLLWGVAVVLTVLAWGRRG